MIVDTGRFRHVWSKIVLTGNNQLAIAGNGQRVFLSFNFEAFSGIRISTIPTFAAGEGLLISHTVNEKEFYWNRHGSLVTAEWWIRGTMNTNVTILETLLLPHG